MNLLENGEYCYVQVINNNVHGVMIFFRNALSLNMLDQLHAALSPDPPDLRVIIITHTGPVFSAGHDLKELVLLPVCLSLVLGTAYSEMKDSSAENPELSKVLSVVFKPGIGQSIQYYI